MINHTQNNTIARFIFYAFVAMVLFLADCGYKNKINIQPFTTITVIANYDFIKTNNAELIHIEDSFLVSYYQNLVMFQVPEIHEVTKPIFKNDTIEEKIVSSQVKYKYYIYRFNDSIGYRYDSINDFNHRKFKVDSFLNAKAFAKFKFYDKENDLLIESKVDQKTNLLVEKYIPHVKYDETYPDSSYRYYSESDLKNVGFSFSKYLDSIRNKKLIKVKFTHNPIPKGKYAFDIPERNLIFEMKKTSLTNSTEIINLFEKVKQLSK